MTIRKRIGLFLTGLCVGAIVLSTMGATAGTWVNHLSSSEIRELVWRDGKVYAATSGGLLVYEPAANRFEHFTNVEGLPSNVLNCLVFDASGDLWVGSADIGVFRLDLRGGRVRVVRSFNQQIDGLADNNVLSVAAWGQSLVYGTQNGMGTISGGFPTSPYFKRDGLPDDRVVDVFPLGNFVWVATDSGVVVLDRFGLIQRVAGAPPSANVFGSDSSMLYVGSDDGIDRFNPADSSWTSLGLTGRSIHSVFFDGQSMWAADRFIVYRQTGITNWAMSRMDSMVFLYDLRGSATQARGLVVVPGGDVYAGLSLPSEERGANLIRIRGGQLKSLRPNDPGGADVLRLSFDTDGSLWASFFLNYVGRLTPSGTWMNYNGSIPESDSLSNRFANLTCLADSRGIKWFCTLSDPTNPRDLDRLDDHHDLSYATDTWRHIGIGDGGGDGLGSLRLQNAAEDPNGNIWFLSDAEPASGLPAGWWGIQIYNPALDEWKQINPATDPSMPDGNVVAVAFADAFAFIALREYGIQPWIPGGYSWSELTNLADDQWATPLRVGADPGQINGKINDVVLRSDNVLWIATDNGLYKWSQFSNLTYIGPFTGLTPGLLSPQVSALALDHDENLWVATASGLNRIHRDDDTQIDAWSTAPEYQRSLAALRYPLSVISPLADANCRSLAIHPTRDEVYVGTLRGLSVFDYSPASAGAVNLSGAYVYPNPVVGRKGHDAVHIGAITSPVTVEVFTLEGELVQRRNNVSAGDVAWDLSTLNGFVAASGVYMLRITAGGKSIVRRVALIL